MKKNYITLVLATVFATTTFAQVVTLWGGKGTKDGEFDGGLNNWTTKGVESDDPSKSAAAVWKLRCYFAARLCTTGGYCLVSRTITMIFVRIIEAIASAKKQSTDNKGDGENW